MLCKDVLESFALSANAKKTTKGIPERNGKEDQRAISAKDVKWQVWFEELAEQVTKVLKAGHLDAESILEMKTRISSRSSTTLPVREKVAKAATPAPLPSPPTGSCHIWDPSPSPSPENNDKEGRHCPPLRCQWHYAPEYSEDDRPDHEVRLTRRDVHPSDS
jgi:hypothetical protein